MSGYMRLEQYNHQVKSVFGEYCTSKQERIQITLFKYKWKLFETNNNENTVINTWSYLLTEKFIALSAYIRKEIHNKRQRNQWAKHPFREIKKKDGQ